MKLSLWILFSACLLLTGCGGGFGLGTSSSADSLPATTSAAAAPPIAPDVMRVGDKVTFRLTGVPDEGSLSEIEIPPSGQINVPLLTESFQAAGRSAADVAAEITEAYKTNKIYTNPVVTIIPEERFVNVGGDVRNPQRVPYTGDLTLLSAINACGGFDEYANRHTVRIVRGSQVIRVDCVQAAQVPGADPPVYPGDQITVPRTIF